MSIVLCEPQCSGFEHAAFNAALLATVSTAFPNEELLYFGEQSHLQEVKKILKTSGVPTGHVTWQSAKILPSKIGGLRRLPAERALARAVLYSARSAREQSAAYGVLYCSTTEITILVLKQLLRTAPAHCAVHVIMHGVLGTLLESRWRYPRRWGFSLRQALSWPHPSSLQYIVLSDSIRTHAIRAMPSLSGCLHAIDMPRLWNIREVMLDRNPSKPVCFGYFGKAIKGFPSFYAIASRVKTEQPTAEFSLVGFLNGYDLSCPYEEKVVSGLAREPIVQAEYVRRALQMDYAVWLADPAHYSLTASATFLDALDYAKPLIYLANPYIDAYAEKMGDIGYRCETLTEIQTVIMELARSFPMIRYREQQNTIFHGRELFDSASLAPALKDIMQNGN
jgi:hypothetical protein